LNINRPIHPDFLALLLRKDDALIALFDDLRAFLLAFDPECIEMVYHTHALTAVFSLSEKLSDAYCMIPVYKNHLNLGFNKGTLLNDPEKRLTGTGTLMRHIDVKTPADYRNPQVETLVAEAIAYARKGLKTPPVSVGKTMSKIKT
jgi:hypothetical protein